MQRQVKYKTYKIHLHIVFYYILLSLNFLTILPIDGRCLNSGPTIRVMTRRIQEDWNSDGRDTFLYMFKSVMT